LLVLGEWERLKKKETMKGQLWIEEIEGEE
jgi:hypothetical protein